MMMATDMKRKKCLRKEQVMRFQCAAKERMLFVSVFVMVVAMITVLPCSELQAREEVKYVLGVHSGLNWPVDAAVSQDGSIYVLDQKLGKVFIYDKEGTLQHSFGEAGSQPGQLHKPSGIALNKKGEVLVADTGNQRVQVFDPKEGFLYQLGNEGTAPGKFLLPKEVAVNTSGDIFVSDVKNRMISMFSPQGVFLKRWQVHGVPEDIVFDTQNHLYILFSETGEIIKFGPEGEMLSRIALTDGMTEQLKHTASMAVDSRGDIYFMELENNSIIKLDQSENILLTFGSRGEGRGQFVEPVAIAVDQREGVFIVDARSQTVQKFLISGSKKAELTPAAYEKPVIDFKESMRLCDSIVDIKVIPDKGIYALSDSQHFIVHQGQTQHIIGRSEEEDNSLMYQPMGLAIFKDGKIVVADTGNNQVQFLSPEGEYEYKFGKKGNDRSEFNGLRGVVVDKEGYLYVADTYNHRIQVFNQDGIYLKSFGRKSLSKGPDSAEPGTFLNPSALAFNKNEDLYVLDYQNKRIQILKKDGTYVNMIGSDGTVVFSDPVDIAIDERDYLYVADRGSHSIKILDSQGRQVLEFGSSGRGRSYFPSLSAIDSAEGRIYVADYLANRVHVYAFASEKDDWGKRLFFSRTSKPLNMENSTREIAVEMARRLILEQAREELTEKFAVTAEILESTLKIEEEKILESGQVQLTLSIPKEVVKK